MLPEEKTAALIDDLPDPEAARYFLARAADSPKVARALARDEGLLSDALALASWSPLLGTTLAQSPADVAWLARERADPRGRTHEELNESLARFALTNSALEPPVMLARFRRRELLRIYLKDIRRTATVVEITEELSNLADAVLRYALRLASQEMENHYGAPLVVDERGRTHTARFAVVALGKLGSYELNYASDIDLQFVFSAEGATTGTGARGALTNREYFGKLAGAISRLVGQATDEAAAYRVDLRLRPHGRDGALTNSLREVVRYYRESAHPWELQTLIRSRASAGDAALYARFAGAVRDRVYRRDETVARALGHVRTAKRKIDRHHEKGGGYNVKLGRGGIREIEFIAQALQLAYGGGDVWLQAPHTLISLGRLADRAIITRREHTHLSDAYVFLRTLEHRLQMAEGLQTHTLPDEPARRALVARRMHFAGAGGPDAALRAFNRALTLHTERVHQAFARVFREEDSVAAAPPPPTVSSASSAPPSSSASPVTIVAAPAPNISAAAATAEARGQPSGARARRLAAVRDAAEIYASHLRLSPAADAAIIAQRLTEAAGDSLSAARALLFVERIAASLAKLETSEAFDSRLSLERLVALTKLCGGSEYFAEMFAGNPALIEAVPLSGEDGQELRRRDAAFYETILHEEVARERGFGAKLAALRRSWAKFLVEIGAHDAFGEITVRESNAHQSALAAASINVACRIARGELAQRANVAPEAIENLNLAVLGLGRLSGGGLDYGSDLDLILVYDDQNANAVGAHTGAELMSRFAELFVAALSNVTRDGHLYRVDLRLRPDGKNGATSTPARTFIEYVDRRAAVWEWLAYVKLRAVGGDVVLGASTERSARAAIHRRAARDEETKNLLREETKRVRERLERERRYGGSSSIDIKYGPGGMLDVYFAVRYLQLRDGVEDREPDRSTRGVLDQLRAVGSLPAEDYDAFSRGYALLRAVDHYVRLISGRATRLPNSDHPALRDVARRANFDGAEDLLHALRERMRDIRAAYERVTRR